eukprot:scaffold17333_cov152-Isochrysis_galbana.AAC.3
MADLPRSPHRGALRSRTYIGIAAAMALQWMPTLLGYCKIRTSRPRTVNEMLHAARLSLAATPTLELPLKRVAHVDADPRAAPIKLGGGEESEDGPSLESNQRPYPEIRAARFQYAMQWLPSDLRADYQLRQQWIDNDMSYLDGLALAVLQAEPSIRHAGRLRAILLRVNQLGAGRQFAILP